MLAVNVRGGRRAGVWSGARIVLPGLAGVLVVVVSVASVALSACSSSETSSSTSSSGGGTDGGGTDTGTTPGAEGGADAGSDAAAVVVNSCKTFDDRTAAGANRTIAWGFPLPAADRCIAIKTGQSVTWNGNFTQYRVAASTGPAGGDTPNPIATFDESTPTVKFTKAGTYGFESPDAPALQGAIKVSD